MATCSVASSILIGVIDTTKLIDHLAHPHACELHEPRYQSATDYGMGSQIVQLARYRTLVRDCRTVRAAGWPSVDGLTWSRAPHDESVFGDPDIQLMDSVVAGG